MRLFGWFRRNEAIYYVVAAEAREEWTRFGSYRENDSYVIVYADSIRYRDNNNRVEFRLSGVRQLVIHHAKARVIRRANSQEIFDHQQRMNKLVEKHTETVTAITVRDQQIQSAISALDAL